MALSELRDLFIVIYAGLGIVATVLIIVFTLLLYFKVSPILDSAAGTARNVRGTSTFVSDTIVKPIIKVRSFTSGVQRAMGIVTRLSGRKEEREDG